MGLYCPICGGEYKSLYSLRMHFIRKHIDNRCPCCGESTKSLAIHAHHNMWHDTCHMVLAVLTLSPRSLPSTIVDKAVDLLKKGYRFDMNIIDDKRYGDSRVSITADRSIIMSVRLYYLSELIEALPPGLRSVVVRYAICKLVEELTGTRISECGVEGEVFKKYEEFVKKVWEDVVKKYVRSVDVRVVS